MSAELPASLADIQHVVYINLASRPDRRLLVENELPRIGWTTFERFDAIRPANGNGAIGCTMSHLRILEQARVARWPHVCIVEDDICFTNPELFVRQMNAFLSSKLPWDVVLLAGNNIPPYERVNDTCVRVRTCQTTTGYLVAAHYYDALIDNIRTGLGQLVRFPHLHSLYAIDRHWFRLQATGRWYLITPLSVIQREDYSDIEKKHVNYAGCLLDLDKAAYVEYCRRMGRPLV